MSVRPIGTAVQQSLALVIAAPRKHIDDERVVRVVDVCMGPKPRRQQPLDAEAARLGLEHGDFKQRLKDTAAATVAGAPLAWSAWVLALMKKVDSKEVRAFAMWTTTLYDETPLTMNCREKLVSPSAPNGSTDVLLAAPSQSRRRISSTKDVLGKLVKQTAKIMQIEFTVHALLIDRSTGKAMVASCPVPVQLMHMDTCSGETTRAALKRTLMEIPLLEAVRAQFEITFDGSVSDRAATNRRAERALAFYDYPTIPRLHPECHVHMLSGVQGKVFCVTSDAIAGTLAVALAMRAGGSVNRFRLQVQKALLGRVKVVPGGSAPLPDSEAMRHRKAVLDLCLPGKVTGSVAIRRLTLERHLHSDWSSHDIFWYPAPGFDVLTWAEETAAALAPAGIPPFPRHRWVASLASLSEVMLLECCHGIFSEAAAAWLDVETTTANQWQAVNVVEQVAEILAPGTNAADFWKAFNDKQKSNSKKFVLSKQPSTQIPIMRVSLEPQARLMRHLLDLSSESWEKRQAQLVLDDRRRAFAVVEAATGSLTAVFWQDTEQLLTTPSLWDAVPATARTARARSLAFALVARAAGGVFQQIDMVDDAYPWRLWRLMDDELASDTVAELLATPNCLLDEFTKWFMVKFKTEAALKGEDCRALLSAVALHLPLDVSRIECRHGLIRRGGIMRSQTHSSEFSSMSADFVLGTAQRVFCSHWSRQQPTGDGAARVRSVKRYRHKLQQLRTKRRQKAKPKKKKKRKAAAKPKAKSRPRQQHVGVVVKR